MAPSDRTIDPRLGGRPTDVAMAATVLADHDVAWIAAATASEAVHPFAVADHLEVVPHLTPSNLDHLAEALEVLGARPVPPPHRRPRLRREPTWSPRPTTAANLDRLLVTAAGPLDIVPERFGRFEELDLVAVVLDAGGCSIRVAIRDA